MTQETRPKLSRDRIVATAMAYADNHGFEAISMRNIAQELGVVPMALYKHVANKEALLDDLVDALIGEFSLARTPENWREEVLERILAARATLARHPWGRLAIESRTHRTLTVLDHQEAISAAFLRGGFSSDLVHHLMHALGNRIWGFSPELFDAGNTEQAAPEGDGSFSEELQRRYPTILEISRVTRESPLGACDEDFEFRFALYLLLDGAQRLHESGWRSQNPQG